MRRVTLLLLATLAGLLAIAGCNQPTQPAPERGFGVSELLLDLQGFPEGWYIIGPPGPVPSGDGAIYAPDSIRQQFGADGPGRFMAVQEVYRFLSTDWARDEHQRQLPILYNSRSIAVLTPWEPPTELPYQSSVADESHFACSRNGITGFWGCRFMGQYDEYLVIFTTRIGDQMGYADLERLLRAIDERMKAYLAENAP